MRKLSLTALFVLGVGLIGVGGASAAPIGAGLDNAAKNFSPIENVVLVCRRIEVCRQGPMRRICRMRGTVASWWKN